MGHHGGVNGGHMSLSSSYVHLVVRTCGGPSMSGVCAFGSRCGRLIIRDGSFRGSCFNCAGIAIRATLTSRAKGPVLGGNGCRPMGNTSSSRVVPLVRSVSTCVRGGILPCGPLTCVSRTGSGIKCRIPFAHLFCGFITPTTSSRVFRRVGTLRTGRAVLVGRLFKGT